MTTSTTTFNTAGAVTASTKSSDSNNNNHHHPLSVNMMTSNNNTITITTSNHGNLNHNHNHNSSGSSNSTTTMKPDLSFCVVWSPLWPITLFFPFIGHTGIATSHGIPNDFQGSYYVGTDGHMAFGKPTRYLKMDIGSLSNVERWDEGIDEANRVYNQRIHNICCDNCHSHVAYALNRMPLEMYGIQKWDMIKLCFVIFFRAKFVSWSAVVCQFLPFGILLMILLLLV